MEPTHVLEWLRVVLNRRIADCGSSSLNATGCKSTLDAS